MSVTVYHSFGGEVEASNTPTIRRLTPSCRHQLPRIAPAKPRSCEPFEKIWRTENHLNAAAQTSGRLKMRRLTDELADFALVGDPKQSHLEISHVWSNGLHFTAKMALFTSSRSSTRAARNSSQTFQLTSVKVYANLPNQIFQNYQARAPDISYFALTRSS